MAKYDIVIIGSGIGGLSCGLTLSKEGYNVCIVEKNALPGGCFQSFKRFGHILDTGIHYLGSLGEGEILNQYFSYFNIMDKINIKQLDNNAFDIINYKGEEYRFAQGYDNFIETLVAKFPREREAITSYAMKMKVAGDSISVEQLADGNFSNGDMNDYYASAWGVIEDATKNETLRQVLSGNTLLYGGEKDKTTFYHQAIIFDSYIRSSWRFVDGSMQAVDALVDEFKKNGGTLLTSSEVTNISVKNGLVSSVELNGKEQIETKNIISTIHPFLTLKMLEKNSFIRKATVSRYKNLKNSYGLLSAYLIQKEGGTPYLNHNIFVSEDDYWKYSPLKESRKIHSTMCSMQASSRYENRADVINLICAMPSEDLEQWSDTSCNNRGDGYEEFKQKRSQELIENIKRFYPGLCKDTERVYTTTPLSYRDYTGAYQGSAYGIIKNYNNPLTTLIPTRTRIPNLYFTGQNLNVHGALGVVISAMLTCSEFVDSEMLAKKISKA